ncbi:hypothetical protein HX815_28570 [Pseudomonas sp. E6002]|uniref:hypothetical protein n=1 Tax=Pseudomonas sp. E6002 TaxID=2738820 RepID=UPI0015A1D88F|nr:hypothetical protein [Pseudomonas sp. E6002]NWB44287.1 hypothetical protein [Pseudomonas sp. E6002]
MNYIELYGHSSRLLHELQHWGWRRAEIQQYFLARLPPQTALKIESDLVEGDPAQSNEVRGITCREFATSPINISRLSELLKNSVGTLSEPKYARAGGVTALRFSVYAISSINSGYDSYKYDAVNGKLVEAGRRYRSILHFVDSQDVNFTPALIVASMRHQDRNQYRNTYDLALIEAGQAYQRIEEAALKAELRVCAMGGVRAVRGIAGEGNFPLLGIIIGERKSL